jgi:hypothetical protein
MSEHDREGGSLRGQLTDLLRPRLDARQRGRMTAVDAAAVVITAALLAAVVLGTGGAARVLLALLFTTAVPGWAAVGLVRPAVDLAGATMAVALSLTVSLFGATVMVWLHRWDPLLLYGVLAAGSGLLIAGRLAARLGRREGRPAG